MSDRANPRVIGRTPTPDFAQAIRLVGDLAFLAANQAGLQIIDVHDPAAPITIGSLDTPRIALDVAVAGSFAYMAAAVDANGEV